MIKYKKFLMNGSEILHPVDEKTGRAYSRVISSLFYPAEKHGFIVVLAQVLNIRGTGDIYQLAEFESIDLNDLLKKALEFEEIYKAKTTYVPPDPAGDRFLLHFNRQQQEKNLPSLHIQYPSNYDSGNISFHLQILRQTLNPRSKILFLHEKSCLKPYLQKLTGSANINDKDVPAIASLAYGVSNLITLPFVPDCQGQNKVETEYDLFGR